MMLIKFEHMAADFVEHISHINVSPSAQKDFDEV